MKAIVMVLFLIGFEGLVVKCLADLMSMSNTAAAIIVGACTVAFALQPCVEALAELHKPLDDLAYNSSYQSQKHPIDDECRP